MPIPNAKSASRGQKKPSFSPTPSLSQFSKGAFTFLSPRSVHAANVGVRNLAGDANLAMKPFEPPGVAHGRLNPRRVEEGRGPGTLLHTDPFPFPAHQTGHAHFEHPAFRLVSPQRPRKRSDKTAPCDGTPDDTSFALRQQLVGNLRNHSGFQTLVNDRSVALSPAHQKQGPFPPPALPGIDGTVTLSDFRVGRHPSTTLEMRSPPAPDLPQLLRSPSLHAVPSTPVDRTGACRFLPHSRGLPRLTGGSASTTSLSRPAQASLALRPARSQPTQRRTLVPRLRPAQSPDQIAR
jgi:hypothetical protein